VKVKAKTADDLRGKLIDIHAHIGVSLRAYGTQSFPYAQTLEGLYYRQRLHGIDYNVVFPFSSDLYADIARFVGTGIFEPAEEPISPSPFAIENNLVFKEVFQFCPELSDRFLPFVSIDTGRAIEAQMKALEKIAENYPIYGIKVLGVATQTKVIKLLSESRAFLDFAESRDIPMLFHTTPTKDDEYSNVTDVLKVVEKRPGIRFCLAHCILFHKKYLDIAHQADNVWVDTAALKIQIDTLMDYMGDGVDKKDLVDADFSDFRKVMKFLCDAYPDTIIWGTDSPFYSYITRRRQGKDTYREFRYKGTYEDEVAALRSLPQEQMLRAGSINAINFLFGDKNRV
jgi:predicted TIM-barrel fold metal-dependent hydrolase